LVSENSILSDEVLVAEQQFLIDRTSDLGQQAFSVPSGRNERQHALTGNSESGFN
jgi:hypothetical protein